ncbi:MAG TPA: hypothetical protein DEA44_12645 [Firmicutes bacterium]|nr:hypothetical protein [Bacillota bacterium]
MDQAKAMGKILYVDLTSGTIKTAPLPRAMVRKYLGGFGITNRLAYDLIKPGTDALAPENAIIIGTGLFAGTLAPGSSKDSLTTKFPLNGRIGTASGGGLSFCLKNAGYDYVVISGRAPELTYLNIADDRVELLKAGELKGLDTVQTTERLWESHGSNASVLANGPAGEQLLPFALAMINKLATLGRGGLGAVMGAKNLKAIVVYGTKGVKVADPTRFMERCNALQKSIQGISWRKAWLEQGIMIGWPSWSKVGFSRKNWRELYPADEAFQAYGPKELGKMKSRTCACQTCLMADKVILEVQEGPFAGLKGHFSYAFGPVLSWGIRHNLADYPGAVKLRNVCDRLGIDDMYLSGLLGFVAELQERGIISPADLDGLELRNETGVLLDVIDKVIRQEGFGAILRGGYPEICRRWPAAQQFAVCIKGQEPFLDPRGQLDGMAISQVLRPRGAYAVQGNSPAFQAGKSAQTFKRFLSTIGAPAAAAALLCDDEEGIQLYRLIKYAEDWYTLASCVGVCVRQPVLQNYDVQTMAELVSATTGLEFTAESIIKVGERVWNLMTLINAREGFTRDGNEFPRRFFEPLQSKEGSLVLQNYEHTRPLSPDDVRSMYDQYYQERGWCSATGTPTAEKLAELGLDRLS